jgi:hypothetical protein
MTASDGACDAADAWRRQRGGREMGDSGRRVAVVVVLATLVFASGCGDMRKQFVEPLTTGSKRPEPGFEWDSSFASPGTSLTLEEKDRSPGPGGTMLQYGLMSTGFDPGEPVELWWKRGPEFQELPATVSEDGTVLIGGMDVLAASGLTMGQAIDVALASGERRAQAKIIPFPIEARSGVLWASAEIMSDTGLLFLITMGGFEPAEKVEVTSEFKSESLTDIMEASPTGEIAFPVRFSAGDAGTAVAVATGTVGSILLEYLVGEDALEPR